MELNIEKITTSLRRIKFQLPADVLFEEINRRTQVVSKDVSAPGFRKGRVPAKIIHKQHGERIRRESIVELLKEEIESTLVSNEIIPVDSPTIDEYSFDKPNNVCDIWIICEVVPEVSVTDIKGLKTVRPVVKMTQQDIDNELNKLRYKFQKWVAVDRKALEGDRLSVSVEVYENATKIRRPSNIQFIDLRDEFTRKSIKDACIGTAKGDSVSAEIRQAALEGVEELPALQEDSQLPEQTWFIDVHQVQEIVPGEYEPRYFETFEVESEDDEDFPDKVRKVFEKIADEQVEAAMSQQVMTLLRDKNKLDIPQVMLVKQVLGEMENEGIPTEKAIELMKENKDLSMLEKFHRARLTISDYLIFTQIKTERGLQIDEQVIDNEVRQLQHDAVLNPDDTEMNHLIKDAKRRQMIRQQTDELLAQLIGESECETVEMDLAQFGTWLTDFNVLHIQNTDEEEGKNDGSEQSVILDAHGNPIEKAS